LSQLILADTFLFRCFYSGDIFVKLLTLSVGAVLLLLTFVSSSTAVYAQSAAASGKASQKPPGGSPSGKTTKTGSTSKQQ
jgi:hypothetical protein